MNWGLGADVLAKVLGAVASVALWVLHARDRERCIRHRVSLTTVQVTGLGTMTTAILMDMAASSR